MKCNYNIWIIFFIISFVIFVILAFQIRKSKHRERNFAPNSAEKINKTIQRLKVILDDFISRLYHNNSHDKRIKRLYMRWMDKKTKILESIDKETYTINKGEKIYMCMRDYSKNGKVHSNLNLIVFVALHELGHIMTLSTHHTPEFWDNFEFLLHEASKMGYYTPVDYSYIPENYCAMVVNDNPLFREKSKKTLLSEFHNAIY